MAVTISGSSGVTYPDNTIQASAGYPSFKNRIINGAMMIDQRNAGASVAVPATNFGYLTLDRYRVNNGTDGAFTLQQSTTAPTGFKNSMAVTVTTADTSIAAGQFVLVQQSIEGYNVSDLGFGAAGAATVTLSFWVRSAITGTFGGSLANGGSTRTYPFSYVINAANTWEQKTVTVAGDTSGTWLTDNGAGLIAYFTLACGSTYAGPANTWATATYLGVSGQANIMSTVGNTFYITGVQLEKGSTATSFDYREYGEELRKCQRYYQTNYSVAVYTTFDQTVSLKTTMRTAPSVTGSPTSFGTGTITTDTVGIYGTSAGYKAFKFSAEL